MKKIILFSTGIFLVLATAIPCIRDINRKQSQLQLERNGIEYRIMELKSSQESVGNGVNLTNIRTVGPKQAITL